MPARLLAAITGVHIDTARRWKRRGYVPGGYDQLVALRTTGDLGVLSKRWEGFTLLHDQLCTRDGWTITPGELAALPLRYQQLREFERLFECNAERVQL